MAKSIVFIVVLMLAVICFFISFLHWREKGFLLNNTYIFASKQEKEKMNKTPYYRQSAIVFSGLSLVLLLIAIDIILETEWLIWIIRLLEMSFIVWAIGSFIKKFFIDNDK